VNANLKKKRRILNWRRSLAAFADRATSSVSN